MPRQFSGYEPDQIDCNTIVTALAQDFGLRVEITTDYGLDQVHTIVRCFPPSLDGVRKVQVQAVVRTALRTRRSLYVAQYSALLDCWHQCDRGVLAAASRPIERGWNGRPKTPAKRT